MTVVGFWVDSKKNPALIIIHEEKFMIIFQGNYDLMKRGILMIGLHAGTRKEVSCAKL